MNQHPKTPRPDWACAEFVEGRVLPVVAAFALGVVLTLYTQDDRTAAQLAEAAEQVRMATRDADNALALARRYDELCTPLLTLPLSESPEVMAADLPASAGGML